MPRLSYVCSAIWAYLAPIFKIYEAVEDGRADIAIGPASFIE